MIVTMYSAIVLCVLPPILIINIGGSTGTSPSGAGERIHS